MNHPDPVWLLSVAALTVALGAQNPDPVPTHVPPHVPVPANEHVAVAGADTLDGSVPSPSQTVARALRRATPIHTAASDQGLAYGIWATGGDYKASFHDGASFVPYLGSDYPHNQPFSWTTRSVAIGGSELVTSQPSPRQEAFRYEYDLGGVIEAYDVRVDGLEQTFVIQTAPAQRGDLIVRGSVDTLLTAAAVKAAHQALTFVDHNGDPILSYGEAFVVDAAGRKLPMETAYADGIITLSLSAQQLDALTFPIVVDPLLGNISLRTGSDLGSGMDCLREDEGTSNNVWYSYSRAASSGDEDLFVWRRNDAWAGSDTLAYQDATTSWTTNQPQIASVSGANKTITVFERDFTNGVRAVRWHTHEYSDLTSNTSAGFIGNPSGQTRWRPDVGGTVSFTGGTTAMIVFQNEDASPFANSAESDIYAVPVDLSGTGQGVLGAEVEIVGSSANVDFERPRINQQSEGGAAPVWILVYQSYNNSITGDDWDVTARVLDATGSPGAVASTEVSSSDHKLGPVVAGEVSTINGVTAGRYSVMYAIAPLASVNFKTGVTTGFDIRTRRLTYNGTSLLWDSNLSSLSEIGLNTGSRRWVPGGLAADTTSDSHWMGSMRSAASNSIYLALSGYRGGYVRRDLLAGTSGAVVGGLSYNDDNLHYIIQCGDNDGTLNPVIGDVWEYPVASVETMTGSSCSRAVLNWTGRGSITRHQHHIGQGFGELHVTGAPTNAIHFMVVSLGTFNRPVAGPAIASGCNVLVQMSGPDYLGVLDFRIGSNVSWDQPIPEFLAADTIYFQDWHTNNTGTLFYSTPRLEVEIVE